MKKWNIYNLMIKSEMVGDVKGIVFLDNEGKRIIAKYYNAPRTLENTSQ